MESQALMRYGCGLIPAKEKETIDHFGNSIIQITKEQARYMLCSYGVDISMEIVIDDWQKKGYIK